MKPTYLYVLESSISGRHYVGVAADIESRLDRHNTGRVPVTKKDLPYKLIYSEIFGTLALARRREKFLKSGDGRRVLKRILAR